VSISLGLWQVVRGAPEEVRSDAHQVKDEWSPDSVTLVNRWEASSKRTQSPLLANEASDNRGEIDRPTDRLIVATVLAVVSVSVSTSAADTVNAEFAAGLQSFSRFSLSSWLAPSHRVQSRI
jgi:hypothetical protein